MRNIKLPHPINYAKQKKDNAIGTVLAFYVCAEVVKESIREGIQEAKLNKEN